MKTPSSRRRRRRDSLQTSRVRVAVSVPARPSVRRRAHAARTQHARGTHTRFSHTAFRDNDTLAVREKRYAANDRFVQYFPRNDCQTILLAGKAGFPTLRTFRSEPDTSTTSSSSERVRDAKNHVFPASASRCRAFFFVLFFTDHIEFLRFVFPGSTLSDRRQFDAFNDTACVCETKTNTTVSSSQTDTA